MAQKTTESIEMIDSFTWGDRDKIITRDVHGISGLMNFTYVNRLAAKPASPLHYHRGIIEIHCVIKGRKVTQLERDGQRETISCTGGQAMVIRPGEHHAAGADSRQEPCECLSVQLNLSEGNDFLGLNRERGQELCARFSAFPHRMVSLGEREHTLLRDAFALFASHDPVGREAGLAHLVCFLYRFLNLPPVDTPLRIPSDIHIREAVAYIEQNIAEPLTLEELASLAGYSLSRFKVRFREETGQTPALYITSRKVERAKTDLEQTDRSVTEIAYDLGWSSGNYFCSVFKKMTGVSPLHYRRQSRTLER